MADGIPGPQSLEQYESSHRLQLHPDVCKAAIAAAKAMPDFIRAYPRGECPHTQGRIIAYGVGGYRWLEQCYSCNEVRGVS